MVIRQHDVKRYYAEKKSPTKKIQFLNSVGVKEVLVSTIVAKYLEISCVINKILKLFDKNKLEVLFLNIGKDPI